MILGIEKLLFDRNFEIATFEDDFILIFDNRKICYISIIEQFLIFELILISLFKKTNTIPFPLSG